MNHLNKFSREHLKPYFDELSSQQFKNLNEVFINKLQETVAPAKVIITRSYQNVTEIAILPDGLNGELYELINNGVEASWGFIGNITIRK